MLSINTHNRQHTKYRDCKIFGSPQPIRRTHIRKSNTQQQMTCVCGMHILYVGLYMYFSCCFFSVLLNFWFCIFNFCVCVCQFGPYAFGLAHTNFDISVCTNVRFPLTLFYGSVATVCYGCVFFLFNLMNAPIQQI